MSRLSGIHLGIFQADHLGTNWGKNKMGSCWEVLGGNLAPDAWWSGFLDRLSAQCTVSPQPPLRACGCNYTLGATCAVLLARHRGQWVLIGAT